MSPRPAMMFAPWLFCLATPVVCDSAHAAVVEDLFGRDLSAYGLVVPDWEGYMANPAIEFLISAPPGAILPVTVALGANDPRLYFDLPSTAGPQGPRKEVSITGRQPVSVHIALFPARQKHNAERMLAIQVRDGGGRRWQANLPVHEVAIETHDSTPTYPIIVDFSQDQTGFYKDPSHRAAFEQAVADWAFYLEDMHLDRVAPGTEKTWIFNRDGFNHGRFITNAKEYTGTLLYTHGIATAEIRSGGEPSRAGGWQRQNGAELPIRRSGGVEVEIHGNYNTHGWMPAIRDEQWFQAMVVGKVPSDLYSVVHHEMGHALFFNPANKRFPRNGVLQDQAVRDYLGSDPRTDVHDHFDGMIDPVSLRSAFGNEYHGKTPFGRWLITKFDLLCAQAIGYKLRRTAPFVPLGIKSESLATAVLAKAYNATVEAEGGTPFYDWSISAGQLPPGLSLNRFTGQIVGSPKKTGTFEFTLQVREYRKNAAGVSVPLAITVDPG